MEGASDEMTAAVERGKQGGQASRCPLCGAALEAPDTGGLGGMPAALRVARLLAGGSGAHGSGETTCPACGKKLYMRRNPKTGATYLLARADALSLDAARGANLYLGMCDDAFERFAGGGPQEAGAVSRRVWDALDRRRRAAVRACDWNAAGKLALAKARHLHATGKPSGRFHRDAMRYQLLDLQARGATHVRIAAARDASVCPRCAALAGKVLTIEEALQTMPLPVSCDDEGRHLRREGEGHGWCRCFYVRQE